ncbi:hypothetical protein HRbin29_01581 [bacterium HR29]|jgi:predicted small metal-binding protein|nr:hypothetical protein HRbin29_01581 [bacterium HR29]
MKEFHCGDVVPGCTATFRFATDEEIFAAVVRHARADHGMAEVPPEVMEEVRRLIRPAA